MLKTFRHILITSALVGTLTLAAVVMSDRPTVASSAVTAEYAAGRKSVTVFADNSTEAVARAEKANPGWKAVSAKKSNNDPKSRAWQVVMVNK